MSLPNTFNDIIVTDADGQKVVVLANDILETGDSITIPEIIVEGWLESPETQSVEVQEYLTKWKSEGLI